MRVGALVTAGARMREEVFVNHCAGPQQGGTLSECDLPGKMNLDEFLLPLRKTLK
jgi:hypothetical protein